MSNPLVSVVLISFNHGEFVGEAISSILAQSHRDFELIIVDDGSTDHSTTVIESFTDPRIKVVRTPNLGPSRALNRGLKEASGDFVAVMSSDDRSHVNRLERQLEVISSQGKDTVVFTWVNAIDAFGEKILVPRISLGRIFNVKNQERADILNWFFHHGNFLCGPSVLLSRKNFISQSLSGEIASPYLYQLQDFDLWIRLVCHYKFHIIEEPLVDYRIHGRNLSRVNSEGANAVQFESFLIFQEFFSEMSDDLFYQAFPQCGKQLPDGRRIDRRIEETVLFLENDLRVHKLIGIQRYYRQAKDPATAKIFADAYGIDHVFFRRFLMKNSIIRPQRRRTKRLLRWILRQLRGFSL